MNRIKFLNLSLMVAVVVVTSVVTISCSKSIGSGEIANVETTIAEDNKTNEEITKYENVEFVQYLNENEVLTLTEKDKPKNGEANEQKLYCSIYNLKTKSLKDYKDINMHTYQGVSPNKNYVLYSEKIVNVNGEKVGFEQEDSYSMKAKLLDLSTGEITDVLTEKENTAGQFKWISNNKILEYNCLRWQIVDLEGKIYASANCSDENIYDSWVIIGSDDIIDSGDSVEGKLYYTQNNTENNKIKVGTIDVKTGERKIVNSIEQGIKAYKKGKTIMVEKCSSTEQASDGSNSGFSYSILSMDEGGKILQEIKIPKDRKSSGYQLSPDGTKLAYLEFDVELGFQEKYPNESLKVVNTISGKVEKIVKVSDLSEGNEGNIPVDKEISSICWDSTGTKLTVEFTNSPSNNVDSYIISLG